MAAHTRIKAEIEAAGEALETARIHLDHTRITAPVSGRIGRSFVTPGALVTGNQPEALATIRRISPVYVDVAQSSAELLRMRQDLARGSLRQRAGSAVRVKLLLEDGSPYTRLTAGAGEERDRIEGELLFSDISVGQSTGMVSVRAKFDNPEEILLPGMYVRAIVEEGVADNVLLVPQKSVARDIRNRPQVFVLTRQNPAEKAGGDSLLGESEFFVAARQVTLERDYENAWLVSGELAPGDLLVLDGLQHVRPGMVVTGRNVAAPSGLAAQPLSSDQER
jgi:membrane fusion protein (multidrug efflux system)